VRARARPALCAAFPGAARHPPVGDLVLGRPAKHPAGRGGGAGRVGAARARGGLAAQGRASAGPAGPSGQALLPVLHCGAGAARSHGGVWAQRLTQAGGPAHRAPRPHASPPQDPATHWLLVVSCASLASSKYLRISLARCRCHSIVAGDLLVGAWRWVVGGARQRAARAVTAARRAPQRQRRSPPRRGGMARPARHAPNWHPPGSQGRCRCGGRCRGCCRLRRGRRARVVAKELLGLLRPLQLWALQLVARKSGRAHDPPMRGRPCGEVCSRGGASFDRPRRANGARARPPRPALSPTYRQGLAAACCWSGSACWAESVAAVGQWRGPWRGVLVAVCGLY
jgi:hypothetical protein